MSDFVRLTHPILAVILIAGYAAMAWRLFTRKSGEFDVLDVTLAQVARIGLLLTYLTGLILSMNFNRFVHKSHHYTSLIPVAVMFVFQILPRMLNKSLGVKGYAWMLALMFVTVAVISFTGGFLK